MNHRGQVITFYSYKGGVGRSMAVANIGTLLASWGRLRDDRVLLVDWDLDAPGLQAFFEDFSGSVLRGDRGLLEYFEELAAQFSVNAETYKAVLNDRRSIEELLPMDEFIRSGVFEGLDLMCSIPSRHDYRRRVSSFDWSLFWEKYPAALQAFREALCRRYRYVLIDSRTGYSDVSGLCSAVLPEKLVIVFSLNRQNLEGSIEIARRSVDFRERSDDLRPLSIFPLASRVESEAEVREFEVWMRRFEDRFEECFREIYADPDCRLDEYFKSSFIRYSSYYSYGEKLTLLVEDVSRKGGLRSAYEEFAKRLTASEYPWQPRSQWSGNSAPEDGSTSEVDSIPSG
jgi:MinD-like ATPase involved in chromosome partitioning or flagellar assembly